MLPCASFFWPNSPHTLYRNEPPAMPRVSDPSVVMNPLQLQTHVGHEPENDAGREVRFLARMPLLVTLQPIQTGNSGVICQIPVSYPI
jgi:hypothetical protein